MSSPQARLRPHLTCYSSSELKPSMCGTLVALSTWKMTVTWQGHQAGEGQGSSVLLDETKHTVVWCFRPLCKCPCEQGSVCCPGFWTLADALPHGELSPGSPAVCPHLARACVPSEPAPCTHTGQPCQIRHPINTGGPPLVQVLSIYMGSKWPQTVPQPQTHFQRHVQ